METLKVTASESGQKLFQFIQRRIEAERNEIHKWIRTGQIRINGKRSDAFDRITLGDEIRIPPFAIRRTILYNNITDNDSSEKLFSTLLNLPIIYEDHEILIINKPAGIPVQSGTGHSDSIANRIKEAYSNADFIPAPVHRLDKDTSGILLVGKTFASIRYFSSLFAEHESKSLKKEYIAWVKGNWNFENEYIMEDRLEKDKIMQIVDSEEGKKAISNVTLLKKRRIQGKLCSLLSIKIFTGRTHQIRVQCASRGFPIIGDIKYGENTHGNIVTKLKLHAFSISFITPDNKEEHTWTCLPDWNDPWNVN